MLQCITYHPKYGLRYWGQTGAKTEPRSVSDRFYEEVRDALNWYKLYGSKGIRGPPYIHTMYHIGVEGWVIIPLYKVHPMQADNAEMHLIRTEPHCLNVVRTARRQYMRHLVRSRLYRHITDTALADPKRWEQLIHAKRISLEPTDCLKLLGLAEKAMDPVKYSMLRRRILTYFHSATGIDLPPTVTLRIPYASARTAKDIRAAWNAFLNTVLYPTHIRRYLKHCLRIPLTVPPRAVQVFCQDRVEQSISTLQKWTTKGTVYCGCRDLHQQADACSSMCIYQAADKVEILGGAMEQLSQMGLNQPVMPAVPEMHRQLAAELETITKALPKVKPFRIQPFTSTVHQHGAALMRTHTHDTHTTSDQVAGITMTHVQAVRKERPNWRVVRIDKNTDCYVVIC